MQALWLENLKLSYRPNVPIPEPQDDEALIRVRLAGICGTDLELRRGYYPFTGVPGHEFVGEVVAARDESWVGVRVVGEINIPCGVCKECKNGREKHCDERRVLGIRNHQGVFAEYFTLPLNNLHEVPMVVSDEAAVFVEPLAAALEFQERISISASTSVLLVGTGRLGMLIAQTLRLTGCNLSVAVRQQKAHDLMIGLKIPVISTEDIPRRYFDVVIDATGSPHGFEIARQAVRPQGVFVLKSTFAGLTQADLSALVVDEITLIGSRCGPFQPALTLLANGQIDPTRLIEGRYAIKDGEEAFEYAGRPGILKVVLYL